MARIEPGLLPVVTDLARALVELEVPYGIVGALVPELLLEARPRRMTNDADVTVVVETFTEFDRLKDDLAGHGFERTNSPHRMRHRIGGFMDLLPFSESIAPDGRLEFQDGSCLNMAGFRHVVPHAVAITIEGGPTLPVAPLPLYVLLKLIAYGDRKAPKDLGSVLHCLERYGEHDDRRYGVDHDGVGVPYEYTCAFLLGIDARQFLDETVRLAVIAVLDRFQDEDSQPVGIAAREHKPLFPAEDEQRIDIFQRFRWYRLGTGL